MPLALTEQFADVVVANEQGLVLAVGERWVGKRVLDPVDLGARVEQRLKGRRRLLDERSAGMFDPVLRQVADGQFCRACDRPAVSLVHSSQHAEQGGLAGAVRATETHTLTVGHGPRDVIEQRRAPRTTW